MNFTHSVLATSLSLAQMTGRIWELYPSTLISVARVSALRILFLMFTLHSSPVLKHLLSSQYVPESVIGAGNAVANA